MRGELRVVLEIVSLCFGEVDLVAVAQEMTNVIRVSTHGALGSFVVILKLLFGI